MPPSCFSPREDGDDGSASPQREHRDALGRTREAAEEWHEYTLMPGGVLIEQDADESACRERPQDWPDGVPLVDQLHPRLPPQSSSKGVQAPGVERAGDDGEGIADELVRRGQELPVTEMRGEDERAPLRFHHSLEAVRSIHHHPRKDGVEGTSENGGQLDHHHAQVLVGAPAEIPAGAGRQLREGLREVPLGNSPAYRNDEEGNVAETASKPPSDGRGQQPEGGDQCGEDDAGRLRRSRAISRPIGMTDKTMTARTTMCTYAPILGMARPRT